MRSAVVKDDELNAMNAVLTGLAAIFCTIAASITAQPLQMISIFLSVVVIGVIVHVNFVRPGMRRRALQSPVEARFVIAAENVHGCDFAVQDAEQHVSKVIVVPKDKEIIVDLALRSNVFMTTSELYLTCQSDDGPKPIEYHNRFIVKGDGQIIIPGPGNLHYIDKHGFYHYKEASPRQWSLGISRSVAFKFVTRNPGRYIVDMRFAGDEIEGENSELTIVVEDVATTAIICTDPKHKNLPCARIGIKPL
jgi:hypothetical protein